jgi:hypothetical protein
MELLKFGEIVGNLSPAAMLGVFIFALLRKWLYLPGTVNDRDERIVELKAERDEYKSLAYKVLHIGERVTDVIEDRKF